MVELPTGIVTFLFTDVEGSTRLLEQFGDHYAELQSQHDRIVRAVLEETGGIEVSTEGDAFFAVFDSPRRAVEAAVAIQQHLNAAAWPDDGMIRVRIGLHSGEGRLGGGNYTGLDVNRAARIASAAHGGQVLLSATTRALTEWSLP